MNGFSGYSQIKIDSSDVEKTAFRTPMGNFHYTIMPSGLKNFSATYQRAMTTIFMICCIGALRTTLIIS